MTKHFIANVQKKGRSWANNDVCTLVVTRRKHKHNSDEDFVRCWEAQKHLIEDEPEDDPPPFLYNMMAKLRGLGWGVEGPVDSIEEYAEEHDTEEDMPEVEVYQ